MCKLRVQFQLQYSIEFGNTLVSLEFCQIHVIAAVLIILSLAFRSLRATEYGLFGKPTVINNCETFVSVPHVIHMGGQEVSSASGHLTSVCISIA